MLNCVTLMGRLTAEPELRSTTSGKEVCAFCIATDRSYSPDGKKTDFINIVTWQQNAKFVADYFREGQMIALVGAIQTRTYEDKKGIKRTVTEVVAREVSFCGSKAGDNSSTASGSPSLSGTAREEINGYYSNATAADFAEITIPDDEDYVEV